MGNIQNENVTLCCFNSNAKMSAKEFCCRTFIWGDNAVYLLSSKTSAVCEETRHCSCGWHFYVSLPMLLIIISAGSLFFNSPIKQPYWKPDLPSPIQYICNSDDIMIHLILQPYSRESALQKELPSWINYLEIVVWICHSFLLYEPRLYR